MAHFDDIYEIAADNYGLVTFAEAKGAGVPTPYDRYAEAVTLAGPGSVVWGDSVLAMLGLAYENPPVVYVAPARRVRRALPTWVKLVGERVDERASYEGVPCQALSEAIRACRGHVLPERLADAVRDARARGLITRVEAAELERETA